MKPSKTLRGGIIGAGAIGARQDEEKKGKGVYSHAGAYKSVYGFELLSVCELNYERAKAFRSFWGIDTIYDNLEEFLSQDNLDVLSICTPDETHYAILKRVLSNPGKLKAVITEKPFCMTLAECREIEKMAARSRVFVTVNNQRRVEPAHIKIAEMMRSSALGALQAVSAYYVKGLFHNGCTVVDTLRMLLGEVSWVMAVSSMKTESYQSDYSIDFLLGFNNNCKAVVQSCDKGRYHYSIFEIDILCSEGRLRILDNGFQIILQHTEEYPNYPGFRSLGRAELIHGDMEFAITHLFRKVLDDLQVGKSGMSVLAQEAIKDMEILELIKESEKQNGGKIPHNSQGLNAKHS